jgi:hypothetical protein
MRSYTRFIFVLVLCCLFAPMLFSAPLGWSFEIPGSPDIVGPPGSTIGWGYTITNLDPVNWLVPVAIDADLFQHASPLAIFDFPVVPPDQTVSLAYNPAVPLGLYQLAWDSHAPLGFVNAGTFILTADWYDDDISAGGNLVLSGSTRSAPYSATVGAGVVPEPATAALIMPALMLALLASRCLRAPKS